ncbi:MAG: MCE family protein, partial [Solirubrobacterales bacterium]|nr:MCE family protein [Solirubrobacterales bacterium]
MRRHRARVSNLTAGLIAAVVVAVAVYLAFGGATPFAGSPFVLKALFTSQTELHIPSPVRIAGVDVGQVTSVQRVGGSSDAAVVTMHIDGNGLPIHANATAAVQSRIFLEGNFYVDLRPGSPNAPLLASGATLPAANTSGPVQLDRVLAALTSNARANLQTLVQGFGAGLNSAPTPGQDATQDPSVRGLTGGQALNESLRYSADAFKASAIVNQALLGVEPHDLSRSVVGNEQVFRALASRQAEL